MLIALALLGCNSSDSGKENKPVDIKITWQDNSDNEDEFIVSRRFIDEVEFTILDYLPENAVSYIDEDIDDSYNYCYKITASNDAGKSDSEESCTIF